MFGKDRDGIARAVRVTSSGQLIGMNNLMDAAINGRLFHACSQASSDTSTSMNTSHTGLLIGNPTASGKYLVMHEFGWATDGQVSGGEAVIGLATGTIGDMALVAAPVIQPSLVGGSASSVAYADQVGEQAATLTEITTGASNFQ